MNTAPAVALPFSSHARLSGAPPRPARPALRLADPGDTPAALAGAPEIPGDTPAVTIGGRVLPRDTPAPRPVRPASSPRPSTQTAHSQKAQAPLRLTRRGRIVVGALAVLIVSAFCLLAASSAQATNHGAARTGNAKVTVHAGQSLWSVAESADPNQDTRLVVQQIIELNGLTSQVVYAGEQLWVPRS